MVKPMPSMPLTERRRSVLSAVSGSRFYLVSAIALSILTLAAVLTVVLVQPENVAAIQIIIGITAPLILALMGAGGIGVLRVIDGHQSQLMSAIAEKERAKGVIEGLKENPKVNIE